MNLVDLIIIALIISGAVLGFLRGFFKELVCAGGFIVSAILAFLFRGPVASFLYSNLPFFKFGNILKGAPILNILLYEIIAFLVMFAIFMIIVKIVKMVTNLVELVLNITIILGVPSKILGAIVGAIEFYIISFVALFILSLPVISFDMINDSKLKNSILHTPVLSAFTSKTVSIFDEFEELKDKYEDLNNEQFNNEAVDLMLKYNIVSVNTVDKLSKQDKITVDENIVNKYRKED